ncbi:MAG: transglutaminase-like domain-containing protein [Clostridiales bacterium]|nr:transglutaminase-like domain-containing protein [Clostridiales bacterium]
MPSYRELRRVVSACLAVLLLTGMVIAGAALAAVWPENSGERIIRVGNLTVDASHADQGYIMARAKAYSKKLKVRISQGDETYTYDLNNKGEYEVFPLQMGSGSYRITLYQNVSSNRYSKESEGSFSVSLSEEYAAFLCPNQYVNYTQDSPAVKMSMELCANLTTDAQKVEAVQDFMTHGFAYDYVRAITGPGAYLGDIDGCFEKRMGLCQDFAAVAACMLRAQGIPTQLVIGYADDNYHAWNNVLIDGEYQRLDVTAVLSGFSKNVVYTAERYY